MRCERGGCAGGPGAPAGGAEPQEAGRLTQKKQRNAHELPDKAAEQVCCCCGSTATCWTCTEAPVCDRCYDELRGDLAGLRGALAAIARRAAE